MYAIITHKLTMIGTATYFQKEAATFQIEAAEVAGCRRLEKGSNPMNS